MKKIFGWFSIYNLNKKRRQKKEDFYDDPRWKIKWIFWYNAPRWMYKHFEGISFDNIYCTEEWGERRTCLIFSGSKHNYWVFFRKKNEQSGENGDWHWCLKFLKTDNDHCGCA